MWMRKIVFLLALAPALAPAMGWGIDVKPWIENDYEVEIRAELLFQHYNALHTPRGNVKRNEKDYFWTLNASWPFRRYRGDFEFTAAHTRHQKLRIDNFRISWCFQWLNDAEDDPFSLLTGIILTQPLTRALHDVSSFHHGHIEGEVFLSFGSRIGPCCSTDFIFRWWNVCGLGASDVGSDWIREDAALELHDGDRQYFRLFGNSLWGLGKQCLRPHHFKGYGKIEHRSVDLGVRYGFSLGCLGVVSLHYARRVYARNFPKNANLVLFEYYLPFGNQLPPLY